MSAEEIGAVILVVVFASFGIAALAELYRPFFEFVFRWIAYQLSSIHFLHRYEYFPEEARPWRGGYFCRECGKRMP